ncbi:MAG: gamma-glutamyl-gamma-aminobutyrate hydrolase family protein [Verrucomicrobia bacterium]|nr:gamma-glutamyl-gamma-aminobutyrate hydrolase family protein [Verrucomicrobiota bacterium]
MSSPRPLIGLTTHACDDQDHFHLSALYVEAVRRAGGIAVLIPPGDFHPDGILPRLDAIVFTGGGDIHPDFYGGAEHETQYMMNPERDLSESALIQAALVRGTPSLCVCRGLQILNVALGGTLHAHLPDVVGETVLHRLPPRVPTPHPVTIEPGTLLAKLLGATACAPVSWHHQAVDRLGRGLTAIAHSPDGIIEAVAHASHPWLVAVQWHPELTAAEDPAQQALFDGLVRQCRKN